MARYRNAYRDELENEEELSIQEEIIENTPAVNPEEETFKKRYGDLRRFAAEQEQKLKKEIEEKNRQISELSKQNFKLPKTEEEVAEWASKYPDVAAIIRTLAIKEAQNIQSGLEDRLKKVDELERNAKMQVALNKIVKEHPDFYELRQSKEFHDWAKEAPAWVRQALYENDEDAQSVIDAVDLYKVKKGITKESAPKPEFDRKAAATSLTSNNISPSGSNGEVKWSESRVAKLSDREYEKYEEEIEEAIRTRKFVYDVSGGAR